MRGPTVPQGYGKTVFLSDAQIRYNELVEDALQELIKARSTSTDPFSRQVSLDNYISKVEAARAETGCKESILVAV